MVPLVSCFLASCHLVERDDLEMMISCQGELREGKEKANDAVIPRGDWFELVSSPHYLAEMVILSLDWSCYYLDAKYLGYKLKSGLNVPHQEIPISICKDIRAIYLEVLLVYGGIMVASVGTDLTIWLLYVFVVLSHT